MGSCAPQHNLYKATAYGLACEVHRGTRPNPGKGMTPRDPEKGNLGLQLLEAFDSLSEKTMRRALTEFR
ncbi:hypothetical protein ACH5RR_036832 [Cinchona calisaya]|uniref:Uncharacterized protein n=1 Tax=Cinchona calisaya TaxID=153742 RepID=A0ABD2Y9T8_9GENT